MLLVYFMADFFRLQFDLKSKVASTPQRPWGFILFQETIPWQYHVCLVTETSTEANVFLAMFSRYWI